MVNDFMAKVLIEEKPELFNISQFLRTINYVGRIKIIQLLHSTSYDYTGLMLKYGIKPRTHGSSKFAYHLRKLRHTGLVELDKTTKTYHLTFRGIKVAELLDSIEKITTLKMSSPEEAFTRLTVNLHRNESWLRPLIKHEIQKAIEELHDIKPGLITP